MATRFAGLRHLDDRRRRRLARSLDPVTAAPPVVRPASRPADRPALTVFHGPSTSIQPSPIHAIVPKSPWKLAAIVFLLACCWLSLVVWSWRLEVAPDSHNLRSIAGIRQGGLLPFCNVVTTLVAAQLSFVNYWYRKRSRYDFSGRYRVWGWTSCAWLLSCIAWTTGLHNWGGERLAQQIPIHAWNLPTVCWLVPAAVFGSLLVHSLHREMRCSRLSLVALWTAVAAFASAVALRLIAPLVFADDAGSPVLLTVIYFANATGLAATFVHTRFVVHISNEPTRTRSWLRRQARGLSQSLAASLAVRLQSWKEGRAAARTRRDAARQQRFAAKDAAKAARQEEKERQRAERDAARDQQRQAKKANADASAEMFEDNGPSAATAKNRRRKADPPPQPVQDEEQPRQPATRPETIKLQVPEDDDDSQAEDSDDEFRGLSKRERRQLRKQRRDQQRLRRAA